MASPQPPSPAAATAGSVTTPPPEDLRPDIALLTALIEAAMADVIAGATAVPEDEADDAADIFEALGVALAAGDAKTARTRLASLGRLLERRTATADARRRFLQLIESKRKLVDTHVKHLSVTSRVYSPEEVATLVASLATAVRRAVSDEAVLHQISDDFDAARQQLDHPDATRDARPVPAPAATIRHGPPPGTPAAGHSEDER